MTNFGRILSEPSSNNPFERNNTPIRMFDFGRIVFENFKACTEETKIDNNKIMNSIYKAINEQREVFRNFVEDSIEFSNEMVDFSIDVLFFADCFKDENFSSEEILELLNDLLEKSKKKNDKIEELKKIIAREINDEEVNEPEIIDYMNKLDEILNDENIGMKEKFIEIHNLLKEYIEDLERNDHKIHSDKIRKTIITIIRMTLNKILQYLKNYIKKHPYLGIFVILAAIVGAILAGAEVLIALLCLVGVFCGNDLLTKLERSGLVNEMNQFCKSLGLIAVEIGKLEIFWGKQTERIEYLIENLERFQGRNTRIRRYQIANCIKKRWENVREESEFYSREMRSALDQNRLVQ